MLQRGTQLARWTTRSVPNLRFALTRLQITFSRVLAVLIRSRLKNVKDLEQRQKDPLSSKCGQVLC